MTEPKQPVGEILTFPAPTKSASYTRLWQFLQENMVPLQGIICSYVIRAGLAYGESAQILATDVLHETAIEALAHADRFDATTQPRPWLLAISVNILKRKRVDIARHHQRELLLSDIAGATEGYDEGMFFDQFSVLASPGPEQMIEANEQVREMLALVSSDDQQVLRLALLHELNTHDLAIAINKRYSTRKEIDMPESPDEIRRQLAYERTLYIYTSALEHGDLDALATILQEASHDPMLEHMVLETHEAYQHENLAGVLDTTAIASSNAAVSGQPGEPITGSFLSIRSNTMKADVHVPVRPSIERTRERHKGWRMRTQNLLIALIAAVIVGGFLAFFAVRNSPPSLVVGSHPTPAPTRATDSNIVITVDTKKGTFYGYEGDNGKLLWSYSTNYRDRMGLIAVKNHQAIFAGSGLVYAIQIENGKLLWHTTIGEGSGSDLSIIIDNGIALISKFNHTVYALSMSDGKSLWHSSATDLWVAVNGVAYATTLDTHGIAQLAALHIENGAPIWTFSTLAIGIAVAGNVVYSESIRRNKPSTLMALSVKDGHQLWQRDVDMSFLARDYLVVDQGGVILDGQDTLCGYQTSDGKKLWCTAIQTYYVRLGYMSPDAIIKDTIYTSYPQQYTTYDAVEVEARDVHQGNLRWRRSFNITLFYNGSNLAASDQNIYVTTNDTLYALRASDGKELWSTHASGNFSSIATGD